MEARYREHVQDILAARRRRFAGNAIVTEDEVEFYKSRYATDTTDPEKAIRNYLEVKANEGKDWPEPEYVMIDLDLADSYWKDCAKTKKERLDLACQKVIGMPSLEFYVKEHASDQGFQVHPTFSDVVKYHMQMILGCQKHGIYEMYIPYVLTMVQFGRAFDPSVESWEADQKHHASTGRPLISPLAPRELCNGTGCYIMAYEEMIRMDHGDVFAFSTWADDFLQPDYKCQFTYNCRSYYVAEKFNPQLLKMVCENWRDREIAMAEMESRQDPPILDRINALIQAAREFID